MKKQLTMTQLLETVPLTRCTGDQFFGHIVFGYPLPDKVNILLDEARINDSSRCFSWEIRKLLEMNHEQIIKCVIPLS